MLHIWLTRSCGQQTSASQPLFQCRFWSFMFSVHKEQFHTVCFSVCQICLCRQRAIDSSLFPKHVYDWSVLSERKWNFNMRLVKFWGQLAEVSRPFFFDIYFISLWGQEATVFRNLISMYPWLLCGDNWREF